MSPLKLNVKEVTKDDACPKCGSLNVRYDLTADNHLILKCNDCNYAVFCT